MEISRLCWWSKTWTKQTQVKTAEGNLKTQIGNQTQKSAPEPVALWEKEFEAH